MRIELWPVEKQAVSQCAELAGRLEFWRQGAPCMYESGVLNARLQDEKVRNWGATIDGDVVIRRSAAGLNAARQVLFVGVSNDTTARAMAEAMHHAGASDVVQLDVNWSYPRFVPGRSNLDVAIESGPGVSYKALCSEDMNASYPAIASGELSQVPGHAWVATGEVAGLRRQTAALHVKSCKFYLVVATTGRHGTLAALRVRS